MPEDPQAHHPLSLLLVAAGYPPQQVGGVEQHVRGLARELRQRGHQVHVFTRSGRADLPQGTLLPPEEVEGIPVTRVVWRYEGIARLADLYLVPAVEEAFASFLAARSFHVAHVHHLTGLSAGILELLVSRADLPTLFTLHDYWTLCPRGQMFHRDETLCETIEPARCGACLAATWPGLRPLPGTPAAAGFTGEETPDEASWAASLHRHMLRMLALPHRLLVPSSAARAVLERCGLPAARVEVVANGVDRTLLQGIPRRPSGRLRVGFLGTLLPSKGLHVLVDAFLRLPADAVELRIHGNAAGYHGDDGYLTRVFSRIPPGRRVLYAGPYLQEDLPRILEEIDVLAVPALWHEAFGLTPREARMAGRPVVVSAVGGLPEAVEEGRTGFVVPPGDPSALAAALGRFLGTPSLVEEMGRPRPGEVRGFGEMASELLELYRAAAAGAGRPRR